MIIQIILEAVYYFLPAYFANISPPIIANISFIKKINYPLDLKKTFLRKRIFGDNKTIIGAFSGMISAILIFQIQKYLFSLNIFKEISIIDYNSFSLFFPFLLGLGAMLGDLTKSFIKRRLNIKPGSSFPIADQLDFVLFALLLSSLIYLPNFKIIITLMLLTPILCLIANFIAFKLKLKKVWY